MAGGPRSLIGRSAGRAASWSPVFAFRAADGISRLHEPLQVALSRAGPAGDAAGAAGVDQKPWGESVGLRSTEAEWKLLASFLPLRSPWSGLAASHRCTDHPKPEQGNLLRLPPREASWGCLRRKPW